jgi:glycine cleavage system aminomethyltransferase T/glycine/D-amino acid oxidase-like deaminating enzyme
VAAGASVVIVGGGIVGCGVADQLTRLGWEDVVVLEQGPLFEAGGSTTHAPGLVFQTNPSKTMSSFASYTVERYSELELDGEPCFYPVGGLEVAATPARWRDLGRKQGLATSWGIESALLTPEECVELSPLLDPGKIYGGYFVPSDGIAKAVRACEALAREARLRGAKLYGETEVTGVEVENGRVRAVETSGGRIETEAVISCAGMWGPRLGRMVGMQIPLVPMLHQYVWTTPLEELEGESGEVAHPILRHQDRSMYFRHRRDHYGVGSYQHRPMPVSPDDILRYGEAEVFPSVMGFTPEDFEPAWRDAKELLPALRGAEIREAMNGLFSFTPDGMPLIGESREAKGFWVAEAVWITHAIGVCRAVAEWMTSGVPSVDLRECDVHRFESYALSPSYVMTRSCQSFREVYDIIHPQQPMEEPRSLRTSPFYPRQKELGAYFLEASGWERPHWYTANEPLVAGRDIEWIERHLPEDGSARVRDITAGTCCVGVWGPNARELVRSLSEDDLSNEAFGYFKAKRIHVREVPVVALRLSYVGELGWELYTTADLGLRLWDLLWEAGRPVGIIAGGRGAFNGLRLEKGYRMWGTDMTTEHDPYEAGLGFAVRPDKGDFVGCEALARRREEGPRRRLVCLTFEDPNTIVLGNEPVWYGDEVVGYVTSAGYGYSIGKSIAYAWVPPGLSREGERVEIQYFGERHGATVAHEPLFDAAMKRMRD